MPTSYQFDRISGMWPT